MEIQELLEGDAERLVELFAAVLPGSAAAQTEPFDGPAEFLRDAGTFALGAYIEAAPVGLAWGLRMRSPSGRLTTYVHQLDVHED